MTDYNAFLENKALIHVPTGLKRGPKLSSLMMKFQAAIVGWALQRGRAAIFADTGLGKTLMQLEWARVIVNHTKKPVLILAPLAVAAQTEREGHKFGIAVNRCRKQEDVIDGINITNYEMLHYFDASVFGGVVVDECFPAGTPVDVLNIDGTKDRAYIETLRPGDRILNASGVDNVKQIYKRKINRAIRIKAGGRTITCSENHPFFTVHGWRSAQDLQPGDYLVATEAAMLLVRGGLLPEIQQHQIQISEVLRDILLSEMAHEYTRAQGESSYTRSGSAEGSQEGGVVCIREPQSGDRTRTYSQLEPHERPGDTEEGFIDIAEDGAQTFRAWGQWSRDDITAAIASGCSIRQLDTGIRYITGQTDTEFSDMLQGRLSRRREKDRDRSRRSEPLQQERQGQEERQEAGIIRVAGVEILEQGHPDLDQHRDAQGHVYFYDIKAERHPSFSVEGVLVHNSSILKGLTGSYRQQITEAFKFTPFKLACTATPAPNDHMELGNHAEFLGVMSMSEMLAMFFVHDGGDTSKWRLKRHAEDKFWQWVGGWAVAVKMPSDLGFEDKELILPPLKYHEHIIKQDPREGELLATEASGLDEERQAKRESLTERVAACAALVNKSKDQWLIWCNLNAEGDALEAAIPGSVQVSGADTPEHKERSAVDFADGKIRVMISKSSIFGFGLNFQSCHNVAEVGISHSWEQFYQGIRRCWRFGQTSQVNVHIFIGERELGILRNIKRKEADAKRLGEGMIKFMNQDIKSTKRDVAQYKQGFAEGDRYKAVLGDCVEKMRDIASDSIHYSIFSPPFASLYTYSNSDRDMGNCKTHSEFYEHFTFAVKEMFRVLMPGRLVSFHCMNLPTSKSRGEEIGIADFRGELIRMFIDSGFIYHSEVVIWKDPVVAMQRTKALGLLHKQLKKDSCMSRQGIPDYLVTMRKPGDNPERVAHTNESFPVAIWQRYASPIWTDINPSDTLQKESAREHADERHICPLQLQVIERGIELWTNPGDTVLSPFMGIGSEGYVALRMGRKFHGVELKESYYKQAVANLQAAAQSGNQLSIFDITGQSMFQEAKP